MRASQNYEASNPCISNTNIVHLSHMAKTMIEVKKNSNENNVSLIRRFTRRMQESRTIQKVKGDRYAKRALSKLVMKNAALKRLTRQKERARLIKLGKLSENPKRR